MHNFKFGFGGEADLSLFIYLLFHGNTNFDLSIPPLPPVALIDYLFSVVKVPLAFKVVDSDSMIVPLCKVVDSDSCIVCLFIVPLCCKVSLFYIVSLFSIFSWLLQANTCLKFFRFLISLWIPLCFISDLNWLSMNCLGSFDFRLWSYMSSP